MTRPSGLRPRPDTYGDIVAPMIDAEHEAVDSPLEERVGYATVVALMAAADDVVDDRELDHLDKLCAALERIGGVQPELVPVGATIPRFAETEDPSNHNVVRILYVPKRHDRETWELLFQIDDVREFLVDGGGQRYEESILAVRERLERLEDEMAGQESV